MEYLSQSEFKKMLLLSYERIEKNKEQINKINVFPVPDQDTGSNFAKTLSGIKEAINKKEFKDLKEFSRAVLDGALNTAQGNAGVIYVGFLASFLPLLDKNPVNAQKLAVAFAGGAERARQSIQSPKEGTILDVIDASALAFKREAAKEKNIIKILKTVIEEAKEALLATREKMDVFKKANVVDAGGLGFLMILESYLEALEGEKKEKRKEEKPSEKIKKFVQFLSYRYEIIALVENPRFNEEEIKEKLRKLGNSIDVVQVANKVKIHIHTDYPDEVKEQIGQTGQIEDLRVEDMAKEVAGEESVRKVSIGIVTDDVAMILPKIAEKYHIEILPIKYDWPEEKDLPGENIYQKMRAAEERGIKTTAKTTQITPRAYLEAYKKQLGKFEKVLCITLTSKLSGCYNSAIQARNLLENPGKIFVLNSLSAASSQALLILKAIELIQEQKEIEEVIDELKKTISKVHLYVIFEDPKWIEALGRISHSQAKWIRRMKKINIHPIMELKDGTLTKGGVIFAKSGAEAIFKKVFNDTKKRRKEGKRIRALIGHADNLQEAENLKKMLKDKINAEISFISVGPTVICAAAGPGTLLVGWTTIE